MWLFVLAMVIQKTEDFFTEYKELCVRGDKGEWGQNLKKFIMF